MKPASKIAIGILVGMILIVVALQVPLLHKCIEALASVAGK